MMYGSKKPNNEAYKLTYHYKITTDEDGHNIEEQDIENIKPTKAVKFSVLDIWIGQRHT